MFTTNQQRIEFYRNHLNRLVHRADLPTVRAVVERVARLHNQLSDLQYVLRANGAGNWGFDKYFISEVIQLPTT